MAEKKCMKCGREGQEGQAFCTVCLEEMAKYPVKPGVVVLLPQRETPQLKPGRRKHPAQITEEQVKQLKKEIKILTVTLILAVATICGLLWYVVVDYFKEDADRLLPGQNYSAENSSATDNED